MNSQERRARKITNKLDNQALLYPELTDPSFSLTRINYVYVYIYFLSHVLF